jgi:hypothetical protein
MIRPFRLLVSLCCCFVFNASPVLSAIIQDGSFENQAVLQNTPYQSVVDGVKWGYGWGNSSGIPSSWEAISSSVGGAWTGGSIARTEDFAAGWKWAKAGGVFGIIQGDQKMSQTFTATTSGEGTLTWYDANRAAWRNIDWFGRPNTYSVTLTDSTGFIQTGGTFNSEVFGGNSYSTPVGNGWWTSEGKKGWYTRSASGFNLQAGMSYTLSFNSLAYYVDNNGVQQVDDRSTFLDDISLNLTSTIVPEPSTMAIFGLGSIGLAYLRRRRQLR